MKESEKLTIEIVCDDPDRLYYLISSEFGGLFDSIEQKKEPAPKGQWIYVSDELPKIDGKYSVMGINDDICTAFFNGTAFFYINKKSGPARKIKPKKWFKLEEF